MGTGENGVEQPYAGKAPHFKVGRHWLRAGSGLATGYPLIDKQGVCFVLRKPVGAGDDNSGRRDFSR
jgi:hypothetical protein